MSENGRIEMVVFEIRELRKVTQALLERMVRLETKHSMLSIIFGGLAGLLSSLATAWAVLAKVGAP